MDRSVSMWMMNTFLFLYVLIIVAQDRHLHYTLGRFGSPNLDSSPSLCFVVLSLNYSIWSNIISYILYQKDKTFLNQQKMVGVISSVTKHSCTNTSSNVSSHNQFSVIFHWSLRKMVIFSNSVNISFYPLVFYELRYFFSHITLFSTTLWLMTGAYSWKFS